MTNEPHKWVIALALLGMLADTVVSHPPSEARDEYHYQGTVPQHSVQGFANERQWLFAHRKFLNQCVLEAVATEEKPSRENVESVSAGLNDSPPFTVSAANHY